MRWSLNHPVRSSSSLAEPHSPRLPKDLNAGTPRHAVRSNPGPPDHAPVAQAAYVACGSFQREASVASSPLPLVAGGPHYRRSAQRGSPSCAPPVGKNTRRFPVPNRVLSAPGASASFPPVRWTNTGQYSFHIGWFIKYAAR